MAIRKLPDDVIARISAGEVITRPYNILKETLENSLDAGCTRLTIRIGSDGLSLLVEDDGDGIHEEDFQMLCKPHCTSKITSESDLFALSSYGFRGEALSSISRCSKVKVRSKRKENEVGFEATYNDTQLATMRAIGMKNGTSVEIRHIFYNNRIRERYFLKRREEVRKMVSLVETYSVFNSGVMFELFVGDKPSELGGCVRDTEGDHGNKIPMKVRMLDSIYKAGGELLYHDDEEFSVVFTSPNFSLKKGGFLLLVNGRLVMNRSMRETLFKVYKDVLPVQRYPLIYLEIRTRQSEVDVNIHPCKEEVIFTGEEVVTERICSCIEAQLRTQGYVQRPMRILSRDEHHNPIKIYSDPASQSISECVEREDVVRKGFRLVSLERLRSEIVDIDTEFFRSLSYVGTKDEDTVLVQHGSSLLNCKVVPLLREYFYQSVLHGFGNFSRQDTSIHIDGEMGEGLRGMLDEYFSIRIVGDAIVTIPVISTVYADDEDLWSAFRITSVSEYDALKEVASKISELYSSIRMSPRLFNIVKRKIIGTESALKCFGLVVTLKELYKNFERC